MFNKTLIIVLILATIVALPYIYRVRFYRRDIAQVRVVIIYQHIMDGIPPERTINDICRIFKETKADFVLRAAFKWYAMPEEFYRRFEETVKRIKAEDPRIIICGSFGVQFIDKRGEYDPVKKIVLGPDKVREMAINLSKHPEWNLTREEIERFWKIAPILNMREGSFQI